MIQVATSPNEYRAPDALPCADCTPREMCREHCPDWREPTPCAKCGESDEARNLVPCETHDRFYCLRCATDVDPCRACDAVPTPCCAVTRSNGLHGDHPAAECWEMCRACANEARDNY